MGHWARAHPRGRRARLRGIEKLALYEVPFIVDDSRRPISKDDWGQISAAIAAGHRGDAVKRFLKLVGAPGFVIKVMPLMPMWSKLKAVAHTLPYDGAIVVDHQSGTPLPADCWGVGRDADARHGWRKESGMDAPCGTGASEHPPKRAVPHARRTNAHGEGESARSGTGGVLQRWSSFTSTIQERSLRAGRREWMG